jgi:predicted nucleic acid-binding protein
MMCQESLCVHAGEYVKHNTKEFERVKGLSIEDWKV